MSTTHTPSTELAVRAEPAGAAGVAAQAGPAGQAATGTRGGRQPWAWHWPAPRVDAGPVPVIAAVGAGLLAASLVPLGYTGIGWLLAGVAIAAAIAITVSLRGSEADRTQSPPAVAGEVPPHRAVRRWEAVAWGVAALALLSVGTFRAAGWLFGLCLFGAAVATVLAITGGRTLRGMALGALLVPAAGWRGVAWAQRGVAATVRRRVRPAGRIGPTIAITVAMLLLFGGLFASADAVFSRLLGFAVPDLEADSTFRWIVLFGVAGSLVLGAVFLRLSEPTVDSPTGSTRRVRLVEWATPVGALVGLFASFVGVQLTVLFGGVTYVLGDDGPTYAQYARGGFWQLLVVTALTLLVIGVVARLAPRDTPVEQWFLRGLLGALAVLTLVIVASALFRMHTYQEAYGFTRLRVLVSVGELWLGLVFLLVLAAGIRLRAGWLPRAVAATGIAALLALAVLNPDRFIAERNLDRWYAGEQLDQAYLSGLSADAVPALVCLPEQNRRTVLARIRADLAEAPSDWRRTNLARTTALAQLTGEPPECHGR